MTVAILSPQDSIKDQRPLENLIFSSMERH